jgi:hypothetical protein
VLRVHLLPTFGSRAVGEICGADVRTWRKDRRDAGGGQSTAAKAYRLLHAIRTAADDGLPRRKPCRIRGAGEKSRLSRAVLSVDQVFDILKLNSGAVDC